MNQTKIGGILVTISFLGGALSAVLSKEEVNWVFYAVMVILGVVGLYLLKKGRDAGQNDSKKLSENMSILKESMSHVIGEIQILKTHLQEPLKIVEHIDSHIVDSLVKFADARKSLITTQGIDAYADVMSSFASGERYLNRVWSASADGYVDEAETFINKAETQFNEVCGKL